LTSKLHTTLTFRLYGSVLSFKAHQMALGVPDRGASAVWPIRHARMARASRLYSVHMCSSEVFGWTQMHLPHGPAWCFAALPGCGLQHMCTCPQRSADAKLIPARPGHPITEVSRCQAHASKASKVRSPNPKLMWTRPMRPWAWPCMRS